MSVENNNHDRTKQGKIFIKKQSYIGHLHNIINTVTCRPMSHEYERGKILQSQIRKSII